MPEYKGTPNDDIIDQKTLKIPDGTDIYGGDGNDTITFGNTKATGEKGNNNLIGTDSNSTVVYWQAPTGVVVNLSTGIASNGYGGIDTLSNIQNVFGSSSSDAITGNEKNNSFAGLGGNDTMHGGAGYDVVSYFFVKSTDAKITYDKATDTFIVVKNFSNGDHGTDILTGIEEISFNGAGSDNSSVYQSDYTATLKYSLAGIWPSMMDAPSGSAVVGPFYAQVPLGTEQKNGLALNGWVYRGTFGGEGTPVKVNAAILEQQTDGTLKLATSKYVTNATTNGAGSVNVADFNGDGRADIFFAAHNESPFVAMPSTAFMSTSTGMFDSITLTDSVMAHDAQLSFINGKPTIFTRTFQPGDINATYSYNNGAFVETTEKTTTGSVSGGMSVAVADFDNNGSYEMVIGDFGHGPGYPYASANKWVVAIYELDDIQRNTGKPLTTITPYFTSNAQYKDVPSHWGVGMTHTYRVWVDDFNHDGMQDIIAGQSLWSMTNAQYPSVLQMLQNQGDFKFSDMTDKLNPDIGRNSEEIDYSLQRIDIDHSGIESYLSSMYGAVLDAGGTRASNYLLLNDGTGRLHIALHEQFIQLTAEVHHFLSNAQEVVAAGLSSGLGGPTQNVDRFIPYLLDDGSLNFLAVTNGTLLTNVPLHYNVSTDYKESVAIDDRNKSMLIRTWAGNDLFADTNANAAPAHIDGGLGLDTASYSKASSTYQITHNSDGSIKVAGNGIVDMLVNIERLQFTNKKIALDLGTTEHGGQALEFIGLMAPTLIKTPSVVGLILDLFDQGKSLHDVCQLALDVGLVNSIAGSGTDAALAAMAFRNVVGSEPDAATIDTLVGYIDGRHASYTQAEFMSVVAGLEVNQTHIGLIGLQQTGVEFV